LGYSEVSKQSTKWNEDRERTLFNTPLPETPLKSYWWST
jgi:hypothetical protein